MPGTQKGKAMKYESETVWLSTEEDTLTEGCVPNSGIDTTYMWRIQADTFKDWLREAGEHCLWREPTENDYEIHEDGRVDICVMNTEDNHPATEEELEAWRAGNKRLWYAVYSFRVRTVERSIPNLLEIA